MQCASGKGYILQREKECLSIAVRLEQCVVLFALVLMKSGLAGIKYLHAHMYVELEADRPEATMSASVRQ